MIETAIRVAIRFYQICLSPVFGGSCRYWPTCSEYALQAVAAHGAFRGLWLAASRLARCHPFAPGGYDPVPEPASGKHCGRTRDE